MSSHRIAVIVNPRSAHGRTARQWPRMERELRLHCSELEVFHTEGAGHAVQLTRDALRRGYNRIISAGGDGTHSEVLNGFFEDGRIINSNASLAILPCGTGSDFAKTLGMPRCEEACESVCGDAVIMADVARMRYFSACGKEETACFLNTCHIGVGSEVARLSNQSSKRFGGFITFLMATLRGLHSYTDKRMTITLDDEIIEEPVKELILAKGQYDGGGMHVAPFARLDNGLFDVYVIGEISLPRALLCLPSLYRGELHTRTDIVKYRQVRSVHVSCDEHLQISPDGELLGCLPAWFEVLPRVLPLVAPALAGVPTPRP